MAKIDQEIKELKTAVAALDGKIEKLQFFLIQIMNKLGDGIDVSASSAAVSSGPVSVDTTQLEERLEQLVKGMVSKEDIEPISQALNKLHTERLKEAEETIDNVTVLLEKGLALTELATSLKAIEAHLQELVTPPK
jgi:hypothetical protein